MLISAMLGIDSRTTMDMDATIKGLKLDQNNTLKIFENIIKLSIDDDIVFNIKKIEKIREDDDYGGYKLSIDAVYDGLLVVLKIDITTGDKITHKEIKYNFDLMLEDRKIEIWSYNLETIIAEKFESIIKRGTLNTRARDFYDIYMLLKVQSKNVHNCVLKEAILNTANKRQPLSYIKDWKDIYNIIKDDVDMKKLWDKYSKNNFYAKDIEFNEVITCLEYIGNIIESK